MATLVGQDGTGWTNASVQPQNSGGNAVYFKNGYLGVAGTIDTAWVWFGTGSLSASVKLCLYDASGALVVATGAITIVASTLVSIACAASTTAQVYKCVCVSNANYVSLMRNSGSSNFQDHQNTAAHFSYTSPPGALPAPDVSSVGAECIIYFTGTAGGGAGPSGPLQRRAITHLQPRTHFIRKLSRARWSAVTVLGNAPAVFVPTPVSTLYRVPQFYPLPRWTPIDWRPKRPHKARWAAVINPAPSTLVTVPNVVGLNSNTAIANLSAVALLGYVSVSQPSVTVALGSVISQSPIAGASVVSGSNVALVVSTGPPAVTLPTLYNIFPTTLPGLAWEVKRTVSWSTAYEEALSGKVSTLSFQRYPIVEWELTFDVLRDAATSDLRALLGLFNAMQGQGQKFLYSDPVFNSVTAEPFGSGDGALTSYQLIATYGNPGNPGTTEIVQQLRTAPTLFANGTPIASNTYSIVNGVITFITPPANGTALTWTGTFYYLCRFMEDQVSPTEFMLNLWDLKSLKFRSIIL